jgi:hypothetical protein
MLVAKRADCWFIQMVEAQCARCMFAVEAGKDAGGTYYRCGLLSPKVVDDYHKSTVGHRWVGRPPPQAPESGCVYRPLCHEGDWKAAARKELDRLLFLSALDRQGFALLEAATTDSVAASAFEDFMKERM